jgi:predicted DNA binding CopG/RHH family protein
MSDMSTNILKKMTKATKEFKSKKNSKLEVRVSDSLKDELKNFASEIGIPLSSLITLWLQDRLREEKARRK